MSNLSSPLVEILGFGITLAAFIFKAGELKATFNSQIVILRTELLNEISAIRSIIDKSEITEANKNQAIAYQITIVEERLKNLQLTTDAEVDNLDTKTIMLKQKISRIEDYLTRKSSFVKKETEH